MSVICGVDGCKAGWVVIFKNLDSGSISWRLYSTVRELVYSEPIPKIIAIDIPIGLPEYGPRVCDLEARQLLGPGRASSVFPAPIRPVLIASSYDEACQIRFHVEGKRMSHQSWAIMPKIKHVDEMLRQDPELQTRIREVHPELSFYFLAGRRRLQYGKKRKFGRDERRNLLAPIYGRWIEAALSERKQLASKEDDILDAFAALWTAERILSGTSKVVTSTPHRDTFGFLMEISA